MSVSFIGCILFCVVVVEDYPRALSPLAPRRKKQRRHSSVDSVRWVRRKLKVGKPHSVDRNLVRADIGRRLESFRTAIRDVVVFIHAVAADAKPADERAAAIQARASGKENNSAL